MMSDPNPTNQVKLIILAASKLGARLFRRNVGQGWIGDARMIKETQMVRVYPGDVVIKKARPFHNGIAGQYDTYGWKTVTVTADMIGQEIAQHVEIEAKQGSGRESEEQVNWGNAVRAQGGRAGVARTIEDVARILG